MIKIGYISVRVKHEVSQ